MLAPSSPTEWRKMGLVSTKLTPNIGLVNISNTTNKTRLAVIRINLPSIARPISCERIRSSYGTNARRIARWTSTAKPEWVVDLS